MARRRREWLGQFEAAVAMRLKREEFYIPYCLATTDWNGAKLFCGSFPGKGKKGEKEERLKQNFGTEMKFDTTTIRTAKTRRQSYKINLFLHFLMGRHFN